MNHPGFFLAILFWISPDGVPQGALPLGAADDAIACRAILARKLEEEGVQQRIQLALKQGLLPSPECVGVPATADEPREPVES